MNKLISLFSLLILSSFVPCLSQTWNKLTSGTTTNLKDVYFVNTNTGWVVGKSGLIRKTTDAGASWTTQTSGTSQELKSVYFASASLGWTAGGDGRLLKTTDGGSTWHSKTNPATSDLYSIFFFDNNTGIAVGKNGIVITSSDGGETWTLRSSGFSRNLYSVQMISASVAIACGENGSILKSTNSGQTWTLLHSSGLYDFINMHFVSEAKGYLVPEADGSGSSSEAGTEGMLYTSTNNTLASISLPTSHALKDVYFVDENKGWAVGESGRILYTSNGGTSWTAQTLSSVSKDLVAVQFTSAQSGYAVGESGTIVKYGYNPASIDEQTSLSVSIFPNPCQNELTLTLPEFAQGFTAEIIDISGKQLLAKSIYAQQTRIETDALKPGIYILQVKNGQQAFTTKFLKNE